MSFRFIHTTWLLLATVLLTVSWVRSARADEPSLSGQWNATALTTKWIIGDWGESCGPKPSGGGEAGGVVTVTQSGNELTIAGPGRTYSTTQCWERYPGLQRVSHSAGARNWKTVCKTAASDPRQAKLSTVLNATDDEISFYEAGQYQFIIKEQNCTASVGRYRTYRRLKPVVAKEERAASEPVPVEKPVEKAKPNSENRCAQPGPPGRLEVRPARKLMRPGEEFAFRAVVADAKGCPVGARVQWNVMGGAKDVSVDTAGKVAVGSGADEGDVQVSATVGGKSAVVTLEIASKERYEALLAKGGFDEAGEIDEAASVAIASQSLGGKAAVAKDTSQDRKFLFTAAVALIALILAAVAFFVLRRSRRAAQLVQEQAVAAHAAAQAAAKAQADAHAAAQADYEARARAAAEQAAAQAANAQPAPSANRICPMCGSIYAGGEQFCGQDGAALVPVN